MYPFALLFAACSTPCPEGSHADGPVCVQDVATEAGSGISATLRACTSTEGDGALDLANLCVEDVCLGDTYGEIVEALGPTDDYVPWVEWSSGIGFDFDPEGEPPPDTAVAVEIWLQNPYTGRSTNGLGVGVPMSCFIDALGLPDTVELLTSGTNYVPWALSWSSPDLTIFDDDTLEGGGDNVVDTLTLEAQG